METVGPPTEAAYLGFPFGVGSLPFTPSGFIGKLLVIRRKIVHENDRLRVLHHEGERPHLRCSLAPMFFIPGI
jgi:hypothetical protein